MDADQLLAPEEGPALGRSRTDVLDMLRAASQPLGVREVAQRMGLHQNTARFHLEALVEAGLAAGGGEGRDTPGRPRIGYRAVSGGPGSGRTAADIRPLSRTTRGVGVREGAARNRECWPLAGTPSG